MSKNSIGEANW